MSWCILVYIPVKSIDLVIPHYIAPYSLAANIHICRAESKQRVKDDIDKISRLPRQDEEQHGGGSHFIMQILLICLDVEINVMNVVYIRHSAVMPSVIAKVKHRHRCCCPTHRIQLRKWLASVKNADFTGRNTNSN